MTEHQLTLEDERAGEALPSGPEEIYRSRASHFAALRDAANQRRYRAANASVLLFLATVAMAAYALIRGQPALLIVAGLLGIGFVVAFMRQGHFDQEHRRYGTLCTLNEEGLRRIARDWEHLPLRQPPVAVADHLYAGDLDLLGHASLQHLLNTASTPAGQITLQSWLLAPATPGVIRERQAAVAELAPEVEFRDQLTLFGRLMGMSPEEYGRFLAWAESPSWLARRGALIWAARVLPVLALVLLVAQLAGLLAYPLWLGVVAVNVLLTWLFGKPVEAILDSVSEKQLVFQPYGEFFGTVEAQSFTVPALRRIQRDLASGSVDAGQQMRRLGRIMQFADLRLSMFFPAIQAALLWNFHVLWLLEGWRRVSGSHVRVWMETLSEMEALAGLASLTFDNPAWTFPEIVEGETALLEARALGHPLLPPEVMVPNDVRVGPPGTFLLVTGSNMSGKSTLLRAIGLNVALAQAGGPVCAAGMRLPPVALATSMRVQDSLERGVSYFMAELERLKAVVDAARRAHEEGERTPLFLLDEILHGTNTTERQLAVRRIIPYLLGLGAIGAVSTHDLSLAQTPELAPISEQVYFTESFTRGPEGPSMRFDYTLRPGLATTTNALKLMEIVGLPVE